VKDDEYAGQNGRFTVGALREYVTSDRSRGSGTALSKSRKHEQQDRYNISKPLSHPYSSLSHVMQYGVQT
jgi:hypothetical protein